MMKPCSAILVASCLLLGAVPSARAFIVPINPGSRQLYFRVGDPGSSNRNTVSVAVPYAAIGNGVSQLMRSDATQATSEYDGFTFCNLPYQVYVGGYYRRKGNGNGDATLTISAPPDLSDGAGHTIPFSEISWASSGNGDQPGSQPFPDGAFNSGSTSYAFEANSWRESCHTFSYANNGFVAAGTYSGTVVYTLSTP